MTIGLAAPGEATRAGRPRSSHAHQAIIDAIVSLLSEGVTFDALSIEAVATRAGVGKATIYRRWPNKQALLADAVMTLKGPPLQPVGDTFRERVLSVLCTAGHGMDERATRIFPCLMPEVMRSEAAYQLWQRVITEPRREVMRELVRRGIADGELRADLDVEVAASVLTGPLVLNRLMRWNPNLDNDKLPEQVLDMVMAGISSPGRA